MFTQAAIFIKVNFHAIVEEKIILLTLILVLFCLLVSCKFVRLRRVLFSLGVVWCVFLYLNRRVSEEMHKVAR